MIPTGSMEDTLLIGDHLLVDKLAYAPSDPVTRYLLPYEDVHRGDIIVFRYPANIEETYVKRAMGIPGDRIRVVNKQVYLNGHALNEPYVVHKSPGIDNYRDNFPADAHFAWQAGVRDLLEHHVVDGDVVVPPGHYFAMGDNRDNSSDSRYWGFVPRENIIGKPLIIYWSYDASTQDLSEPGLNLQHLLDIAIHFPTKTRWSRTLRLIRPYPVQ